MLKLNVTLYQKKIQAKAEYIYDITVKMENHILDRAALLTTPCAPDPSVPYGREAGARGRVEAHIYTQYIKQVRRLFQSKAITIVEVTFVNRQIKVFFKKQIMQNLNKIKEIVIINLTFFLFYYGPSFIHNRWRNNPVAPPFKDRYMLETSDNFTIRNISINIV